VNAIINACPFNVPGIWPIAAAMCSRWLGAGPAPAHVWRDDLIARAIAAIRTGQSEQAARLLAYHEDSLARDPAFLNLAGVLAEARGHQEAARRFYGLSIAIDPDHAAAQQNMRRLFELNTFGQSASRVALGDEDALPALPADARRTVFQAKSISPHQLDRLLQVLTSS
jgi:predicted amidohydrolase